MPRRNGWKISSELLLTFLLYVFSPQTDPGVTWTHKGRRFEESSIKCILNHYSSAVQQQLFVVAILTVFITTAF